MRAFLTAIGFLTILPAGRLAPRPGDFGRAAVFFPVLGLLVGAVLAAVQWCGLSLWDSYIAAALMLGVGLVITGGLHIDGLMDTADALFSRKSPERMLEIMRDSRSGALGVAAGICVMALKFAAYGYLEGPDDWRIVALSPVAGRMAIVAALALFPYAREAGAGAVFAAETRPRHAFGALVLAAVVSAALLGWPGLIVVASGLALAMLASVYLRSCLGGLTGDVYGAINEAVEVVALLGGALLAPLG